MGFYNNKKEMYEARAERFKRDGDRNWAKACSGEGGGYYGKARWCYEQAAENRAKAERTDSSETFKKSK